MNIKSPKKLIKMSRLQLVLLLQILALNPLTISSLPVTSKPIENTPEHLAWEAWIMVPPTNDKTRKITPKSIFILPNKSDNMSSIQCPPGHRVDNNRCIETINIDRNQLLISQLQNLLQSTDNYNTNVEEIDYDYEYDTDIGDSYNRGGGGGNPADYNGEPLRINLSLGKFPTTRDDSKETGNFGIPADDLPTDYDMKIQSFHDEEFSTTTVATTRSTNETDSVGTTTIDSLTDEQATIQTTSTESDDNSIITTQTTLKNENDNIETTTVNPPTSTEFQQFSTITDQSQSTDEKPIASEDRSKLSTTEFSASSVPILSPSESEMNTDTQQSDSDGDDDSDPLNQTTLSSTTDVDDGEIKFVTIDKVASTDFKEDLVNESLVFDNSDELDAANTTDIDDDDSTESTEDTTISAVTLEENRNILKDQQLTSKTENYQTTPVLPSDSIETTTVRTAAETLDEPIHSALIQMDLKQSKINDELESKKKFKDTIDDEEDGSELPLENTESNNRFIYHHVAGSDAGGRPISIEEQLRLINKIVEEDKRRSQSGSKIRFPTDPTPQPYNNQQSERGRSDFVRFPDPGTLTQRFPPIATRNRLTAKSASSSTEQADDSNTRTPKPFAWLPSGWEIDRSSPKPVLVRFWSKVPGSSQEADNNSSTPPNPASSPSSQFRSAGSYTGGRGYRENSRKPTENLYKEISAQDVYKMLGAKNYKHNNR